jgi:hypothetical protein
LQHEPPQPQSTPPHFIETHPQALALQKSSVTGQTLPQAPQLLKSVEVFVQVPAQSWYGAGPHTHDPLEHVVPIAHVPQLTVCPQLFVAEPHDRPLHTFVLSGVQQVLLAWHTPAFGHVAEHMTGWPQLLVAVVLHLPAQAVASSGVQQTLFVQTSVGDAQLTLPLAPQATDCPQLFMAVPQDCPAQVIATGSGTHPHAPPLQVSPPSHPGQVTV